MHTAAPKTWDIFCRVVDNYGDIGVCWRLARQLAREYPFRVRLWVDDIDALISIWPHTVHIDQQTQEQVDICIWHASFDPGVEPADVIIEAFACDLPASYMRAIKARPTPPRWFNLEYLSAEDWVEGCHGLASIHPQLGLRKTFYFPGFTAKTGGLLKEKTLLGERDAFLGNPSNKTRFLHSLGISIAENELVISLFGYENAALGSLLDSWIESSRPVHCLLPTSKLLPELNARLGTALQPGDGYTQGSLRLHIIPFLSQWAYDQLLWISDINFVRGEDSFVRAQWAAKPLVWHIYPQEDGIHLLKLDAFLRHYLHGASSQLQDEISSLWHAWNNGQDCHIPWNSCLAELENWQKHSQNWCQSINSLGDLASNMVQFCQKTL